MNLTHSKFFRAFFYAFSGIKEAIKKERNLKIHLLMASLATLLGLFFKVTPTEWLILTLIIFLVLAAEIFNASIEAVCDLLKEENRLDYHRTKYIRDASAGAVLLLAIASIIIGGIIFLPYLL